MFFETVQVMWLLTQPSILLRTLNKLKCAVFLLETLFIMYLFMYLLLYCFFVNLLQEVLQMSTVLCFLFLAIESLGLKLLMNECSECTLCIVV